MKWSNSRAEGARGVRLPCFAADACFVVGGWCGAVGWGGGAVGAVGRLMGRWSSGAGQTSARDSVRGRGFDKENNTKSVLP